MQPSVFKGWYFQLFFIAPGTPDLTRKGRAWWPYAVHSPGFQFPLSCRVTTQLPHTPSVALQALEISIWSLFHPDGCMCVWLVHFSICFIYLLVDMPGKRQVFIYQNTYILLPIRVRTPILLYFYCCRTGGPLPFSLPSSCCSLPSLYTCWGEISGAMYLTTPEGCPGPFGAIPRFLYFLFHGIVLCRFSEQVRCCFHAVWHIIYVDYKQC